MADIVINSTRKPLLVELVGVEYTITPPKAALAIEMAHDIKSTTDQAPDKVMETLYEWLGMCMDAKTITAVKARMKNPKDDLDIPHVTDLLTQIMERITGNPTTSPSDSSES